MTRGSHLIIGASTAVAAHATIYPYQDPISIIFGLLGVMIGCTLPDLDLALGIRHRTITHGALWPALLLIFYHQPLGIGLALGIISHLAADAVTRDGIPLLWPFPWRLRGPISTGGILEYGVVSLVAGWLGMFLWGKI